MELVHAAPPVSQTIADGFERAEHTLMLVVDFMGAFDRAWRLKLYQKLLNCGAPPHVVRWIKDLVA